MDRHRVVPAGEGLAVPGGPARHGGSARRPRRTGRSRPGQAPGVTGIQRSAIRRAPVAPPIAERAGPRSRGQKKIITLPASTTTSKTSSRESIQRREIGLYPRWFQCLLPRGGQHRRIGVDAGDREAAPGQLDRHPAGAAAGVEDPGQSVGPGQGLHQIGLAVDGTAPAAIPPPPGVVIVAAGTVRARPAGAHPWNASSRGRAVRRWSNRAARAGSIPSVRPGAAEYDGVTCRHDDVTDPGPDRVAHGVAEPAGGDRLFSGGHPGPIAQHLAPDPSHRLRRIGVGRAGRAAPSAIIETPSCRTGSDSMSTFSPAATMP